MDLGLLLYNWGIAWVESPFRGEKDYDRDIYCTVIDNKGLQCRWKTSDSQRHLSTTNMQHHFKAKHSILPPQSSKLKPKNQDIKKAFAKQPNLLIQESLERNLLRWIIQDKQAFLVIESQRGFSENLCRYPRGSEFLYNKFASVDVIAIFAV